MTKTTETETVDYKRWPNYPRDSREWKNETCLNCDNLQRIMPNNQIVLNQPLMYECRCTPPGFTILGMTPDGKMNAAFRYPIISGRTPACAKFDHTKNYITEQFEQSVKN